MAAARAARWAHLPPEYVEQDCGYETLCWVWQRSRRYEYGAKVLNGQQMPAHVAYYVEHVGPVPRGLVLDHLCKVTLCVRPSHLEPVTQGENVRRSATTKLTEAQVIEIRRATGDSSRDLAVRYDVTSRNIDAIRAGRSWRDAAEPSLCHTPTRGRKLTVELARQIKNDTRPSRAVAADYGLSKTTVLDIRREHIWRDA